MSNVIKFPTKTSCQCGWKFPNHTAIECGVKGIEGKPIAVSAIYDLVFEYICPNCFRLHRVNAGPCQTTQLLNTK